MAAAPNRTPVCYLQRTAASETYRLWNISQWNQCSCNFLHYLSHCQRRKVGNAQATFTFTLTCHVYMLNRVQTGLMNILSSRKSVTHHWSQSVQMRLDGSSDWKMKKLVIWIIFFYCASSQKIAYLLFFFKDAFLHTVSGVHAKRAVSLLNKTLEVTWAKRRHTHF